MIHRLACIVAVAALLAGCSDAPAANPGATSDAAPPPPQKAPARFTIERVTASPDELDIGDAVAITVTSRNVGEQSGSATIPIRVGGSIVDYAEVSLAPGAVGEGRVSFTPTTKGRLSVSATIDGSSGSADVRVRAPSLAGLQWDYDDLACTDRVPFEVTFTNSGDGVARGVTVSVVIYNENNVAQDQKSAHAGSVAAGGQGFARFELFSRDGCGRDDYYHVEVTIRPDHVQGTTFTTPPFSI